MAVRNRQIGWSNKSNLLYDVLRETNALRGQFAAPPTTTTTTTAPPPPSNLTLKLSPTIDNFDIPASAAGGIGQYTIEWFAKMTNDSNHPRAWSIGSWPAAAHAVSVENGVVYYWINGAIAATYFISGYSYIGIWTHFCIMRYQILPTLNIVSLYINGSQVNSYVINSAIPSNNLPLYLGSEGNDSIQNGLISNFRWTNFAIYNGPGFTPPTAPLHNVAGTVLNIFQGPSLIEEIVDQSGSGYTINNGTGIYDADNPFVGVQGSIKFGI